MNQNVASETIDTNYVRLQCLYFSLLRVMKNVGVAWSVSSCRILNLKRFDVFCDSISARSLSVWVTPLSGTLQCPPRCTVALSTWR